MYFLIYEKLFGRINHHQLPNNNGFYDRKAFRKVKNN